MNTEALIQELLEQIPANACNGCHSAYVNAISIIRKHSENEPATMNHGWIPLLPISPKEDSCSDTQEREES